MNISCKYDILCLLIFGKIIYPDTYYDTNDSDEITE